MIVAVLATAVMAAHPGGCNDKACVERVAIRRCENGSLVSCVHRGGLRWRVNYRMLMRKIHCENPRLIRFAQNPTPIGREHASGPVQFLPSTFASTPYRKESLWTWKWSSLAMAWMHAVGRGGEWACQ